MNRKTFMSIIALLVVCVLLMTISYRDIIDPNFLILGNKTSFDVPYQARISKSVDKNEIYIKFDEVDIKFPLIKYSFSSKNDLSKLLVSLKDTQSAKFDVSVLDGKKYAYNIVLNNVTYFSRESVELALRIERWSAWFFLVVSFLMFIFGLLLICSKKSNPRPCQTVGKK